MSSAEEILDAIDALPWQDRLRLFRHIYDRVMRRDYKEFVGIDETFARYHKAMHDITGEDCTERTRRRPVVWARYIVAWQMTEDGFTTNQIGARLGIDHSTVSHCRDAVKEMLEYPRYYPQELAVFRKFKKTIDDEIHTRTNAGAPAAGAVLRDGGARLLEQGRPPHLDGDLPPHLGAGNRAPLPVHPQLRTMPAQPPA